MRTIATVLGAALAISLGGSALGEDAAGHWIGKVKTPAAELTLVAHIKPGPGGALEGYAESPDQTLTPLPLADVKATADTLAFTVPSVGGTYSGKWDAAAKGWVGTFTQREYAMALTLVRGVPPPRPVVVGLDGDWSGVIQAPQGDLRIKVHVKTDADGTLAVFESPDQSPMQLVAVVTHVGDVATIELRGIGGFEGKMSPDGKLIDGMWKQGGGSLPLVLKKAG